VPVKKARSTNAKPRKEDSVQPVKAIGNGPAEATRIAAATEISGGGNLDKIRDILFGSQIRDYETRFSRLEEALVSQTNDIRETTKKRLDALESYVRKELEALQSRLKTEREERGEATQQLAREIKDTSDALARKLRDLSDHTEERDRGLREEILRQSSDLLDEMRSRQTELNALLDRRVQELTHSKTDRAALAGMFQEVAMRLKDEFQIPGMEG
jgi:hypothetical protein